MNAEVDREEGDDIDHRERHVVRMMREWTKHPFQIDPILDTVVFYAQARPKKGKGRKVTIPTFALQSPIRLETVYQLDHPVGYYHPPERIVKRKRKRTSPQRIQAEQGEVQSPSQQ